MLKCAHHICTGVSTNISNTHIARTVHKPHHPNSTQKKLKEWCKNHQWEKNPISLHCKCLLNVNADILLLGRTFVCVWNFMIKGFRVPGFSR